MRKTYHQKVSLTTIIRQVKKRGFFLNKSQRSDHDREVLTRYAGELIQHDSSHHLWAPAAKEKWYLITSLDDYSRSVVTGSGGLQREGHSLPFPSSQRQN